MRTLSPSLRSLKLAAVSTAVVTAGLGLAPAALAAAPAPAAVPYVGAYFAGCTAGLNVNLVVRGNTIIITVTCSGNVSVVSVTLNSASTPLPVVPADANGVSHYTVETSALTLGEHTAVLAYSDGTSQTLPFTVVAAQAIVIPAAAAGGTSSGGGLAFTGANAVVPLGAIGAVLVLGGAGAVVAARRRRDDAA